MEINIREATYLDIPIIMKLSKAWHKGRSGIDNDSLSETIQGFISGEKSVVWVIENQGSIEYVSTGVIVPDYANFSELIFLCDMPKFSIDCMGSFMNVVKKKAIEFGASHIFYSVKTGGYLNKMKKMGFKKLETIMTKGIK